VTPRVYQQPNSKPLKICSAVGCNELTADRRCDKHKTEDRPTASQRGYNSKWRKASDTYLRKPENALCRLCYAEGKVVPAYCVDHIIPHRGDQQLFWDVENNWMPLCEICHNKKSAKERRSTGIRLQYDATDNSNAGEYVTTTVDVDDLDEPEQPRQGLRIPAPPPGLRKKEAKR